MSFKTFRAIGLPFFVLLTSVPALSQTSHRVLRPRRPHRLIVGGVDVGANDPIQRSTAALYSPSANGPGGALCTASLISRDTALTAAHCLQGQTANPVMIFGSDVRAPNSVRREVTGEAINPAYGHRKGMDQGDIAIVKLGGGLPRGYKPAVLPSETSVKKAIRRFWQATASQMRNRNRELAS